MTSTSTAADQVPASSTDLPWSCVYYIVLAVILLLATYERFHIALPPLTDADSWGYLAPAVLKLGGEGFKHTNGRNFLYPGFLFVILRVTNSFAAISIVQHLLGLGTGALILSCWAKTKRFVRHVSPRTHEGLGLAVCALYLLSRHPIEFEHLIRPESITPFFAILNILLTLEFFDKRREGGPSRSGAVLACTILVNSVVLATLKTSFLLTILFSVVPVLIALFDRRETWPRRLAVVLVPLLVATAILRTEQTLAASDRLAKRFLPTSLFSIHAKLIAEQMDEDVARGDCGAWGCDWLAQVTASLHEEIERSTQFRPAWPSLGFCPDYLVYGDSIIRWRRRFFGGDTDKQLEFYMYYYFRTIRKHPGRMLGKIIDQMGRFYLGYKKSLLASPQIHLGPHYSRASEDLKPHVVPNYPVFSRYCESVKTLSSTKETLNQPLLITIVGTVLSFLFPPVFFTTLGVSCFLRGHLRRLYGSFAVVVLFVFSYSFGNCLGTAIVHALDVTRYIVAQYSFVLLAECMGILFLVEIGMEARRSGAHSQDSAQRRPSYASKTSSARGSTSC